MYNPGFVKGWLIRFFPYDLNGERLNGIIGDDDEPQIEVQEIPFTLEIIGQSTFKRKFRNYLIYIVLIQIINIYMNMLIF